MQNIHFYNPEIQQEVIDRLQDLMVENNHGDDQDVDMATPGKYVLSSCLYTVSNNAANRWTHLKEYKTKFSENDLIAGFEMFDGNKSFWVHAREKCSPDEFFDIVPEAPGVNTFQFLCSSFIQMQRNPRSEIPKFMRSGLNLLMNRFERTGKLHECYDNHFKPACESFSFVYNYALLPLCLLKMYEFEKDMQYFSTALKGVDVIPYLAVDMDDADVAMTALASIYLRNYHLREFYDHRKFRVPADG